MELAVHWGLMEDLHIKDCKIISRCLRIDQHVLLVHIQAKQRVTYIEVLHQLQHPLIW